VNTTVLHDFFRGFGVIREAVIIPDRFRVRSRGYGFITFKHDYDADRALKAKGISLRGQTLCCRLACIRQQPRRAHFRVKHGHRGADVRRGQSHSDFSLYRTANIQAIDAVKMKDFLSIFESTDINWALRMNSPDLERKARQSALDRQMERDRVNRNRLGRRKLFPNEDIEKDFKALLFKEEKEKKRKQMTRKVIKEQSDDPSEWYVSSLPMTGVEDSVSVMLPKHVSSSACWSSFVSPLDSTLECVSEESTSIRQDTSEDTTMLCSPQYSPSPGTFSDSFF
jgi:RNA recognition motif-containing protein